MFWLLRHSKLKPPKIIKRKMIVKKIFIGHLCIENYNTKEKNEKVEKKMKKSWTRPVQTSFKIAVRTGL